MLEVFNCTAAGISFKEISLNPDKEISKLTLADLLSVEKPFGKQAKESFTTIKKEDSLEIAKILIERKTTDDMICSDVFVTEDGTPNSSVIGWITNVLITQNSTVA